MIFLSEYHQSVTTSYCSTIVYVIFAFELYLHETLITRRTPEWRRCQRQRCPWRCRLRGRIPSRRCRLHWRIARGNCSRRRGRSRRLRRCWSSCACRYSRATAAGNRCRRTRSSGSSRSRRRRATPPHPDFAASSWTDRPGTRRASAVCSSSSTCPRRPCRPASKSTVPRRDCAGHPREYRRSMNRSSSELHPESCLIKRTMLFPVKWKDQTVGQRGKRPMQRKSPKDIVKTFKRCLKSFERPLLNKKYFESLSDICAVWDRRHVLKMVSEDSYDWIKQHLEPNKSIL